MGLNWAVEGSNGDHQEAFKAPMLSSYLTWPCGVFFFLTKPLLSRAAVVGCIGSQKSLGALIGGQMLQQCQIQEGTACPGNQLGTVVAASGVRGQEDCGLRVPCQLQQWGPLPSPEGSKNAELVGVHEAAVHIYQLEEPCNLVRCHQ